MWRREVESLVRGRRCGNGIRNRCLRCVAHVSRARTPCDPGRATEFWGKRCAIRNPMIADSGTQRMAMVILPSPDA